MSDSRSLTIRTARCQPGGGRRAGRKTRTMVGTLLVVGSVSASILLGLVLAKLAISATLSILSLRPSTPLDPTGD